MSLNVNTSVNDQISREAAEWLVEFRTGDVHPAGRRDFDSWLRASPEHIRAFIEMAALWHGSGAIDPLCQLDVDAIVARARRGETIAELAASPGLLTAFSTSSPGAALRSAGDGAAEGNVKGRRGLSPLWLAASSLLVAGLAVTFTLRSRLFSPPTYSTGVREHRSVILPDGSRVLLDSSSRLRVAYTAAARTVDLLQGQALFSVLRNARRPFLVNVGGAVIRDVGTEFDVNRRGEATIVTVVEGRIAIKSPPAAGQDCDYSRLVDFGAGPRATPAGNGRCGRSTEPVYLSAGEQFNVNVGHLSLPPVRVDTSSVTAWEHGQIVLDSASLVEVAQVFSRYSTRRLVAEDLGQTPLRLSGVFTANPDFLIRYLRERPDVVVTETDSEIAIVRHETK